MTIVEHTSLNQVTKTDVLIEAREDMPEIRSYLDQTLHKLKSLRYDIDEFDPNEAYEVLDEDLPKGPNPQHKDSFINDIIRQISFFNTLTETPSIKLQLLVVKTNKCRLFHEDFYRQRLLCTYLGPGTEWLDHSNVNRNELGKGCNGNIVKDMSLINRANTFDVILLKGARYGDHTQSVIHRSPPIEHAKSTRVLLKIDE